MIVVAIVLIIVAGFFVRSLDDFYNHENREIEHIVEICGGGLFLLLWLATPLSFVQAWLAVSVILCAIAIPATIYLKKKGIETEEEIAFSEFLHILSSLLAKVFCYEELTGNDIRAIEGVFKKLELTDAQVDFCVHTFRQCENEGWELYEILKEADSKFDKEVLETLYELLWEVVSQNPDISEDKLDVLKTTERMLYLPFGTFERCKQKFLSGDHGSKEDAQGNILHIDQAYKEFGCNGNETDEELKSRYREMMKQYHPDVLISKGLPKELMDAAKRKIVRLNEVWATIKQERGIS